MEKSSKRRNHTHTITTNFRRVRQCHKTSKAKKYITPSRLRRFRELLASKAIIVRPETKFPQLTSDPNDNIMIETAFDGKASYLVSGDKHLLALNEYRGIKIVTVREMLELLHAGY